MEEEEEEEEEDYTTITAITRVVDPAKIFRAPQGPEDSEKKALKETCREKPYVLLICVLWGYR
eukprot:9477670-Pyramimonas_sp.AAC.1